MGVVNDVWKGFGNINVDFDIGPVRFSAYIIAFMFASVLLPIFLRFGKSNAVTVNENIKSDRSVRNGRNKK